jgi:hypothetical protein
MYLYFPYCNICIVFCIVYSDQVAAPDVGRMGIEILSFTIKVGKKIFCCKMKK